MAEYIELNADLLLLAAEDGDYNRKEAASRIANMTPDERRLLRRAIETLDELLDADAFDRHLIRDLLSRAARGARPNNCGPRRAEGRPIQTGVLLYEEITEDTGRACGGDESRQPHSAPPRRRVVRRRL
jgi:hypothetical protein